LWSTSPALAKASDWQAAVQEASVQKIGLASPKTAPYGAAAMAAMDQTGVLPAVESNLVFGKNVGQAFEYAWSGATDASFVALSQALSEKGVTGRYWLVSEAALITQNACVLSGAGDLALAFFDFVLGDAAAREIINLYGYK
ncbi:MAG: molybdate ABC transporter substrate-binding protein, partial [Proteobacteria bacterium]|nr:molybdate ABC transporter substrate-binding protein [Pseudomonadota bacterium]